MTTPSLGATVSAVRNMLKPYVALTELMGAFEKVSSLEQAAAEADARLQARQRDIELEDARLQARVDTAKGLEDRARLAVETAGTDVAKILAEARAASAVLVNEATAQGAAALEAAEAEVRAAKKRAAVASEKADAADERAAAAEARAEAASEQLAAIREKLGG